MQNPYSQRQITIGAIIIGVFTLYVLRLFYIQIIDDSYKLSADNNSQRHVTIYPGRGLIYDRNGKLLVYNEAAYDLMINPPQLSPFDTVALASILQVDAKTIKDGIYIARKYSRYKPSLFIRQLSAETYAVLQERLYAFPGFFVTPRTLRKYDKRIAAHVFGYVGEVDSSIIKKNSYYNMGDYIGISGIEKTYEEALRGKKGVEILLVDVHNRTKGSFRGGQYDTAAISGKNLICTIDGALQEYGEKLMVNKRGSIVAIEPSTGEILAMVSSPNYDPGLLVGRVRALNYRILLNDPYKPLFNRALMAKYPPGSTFKLVNALIGLQDGAIKPETRFSCSMGYTAGNLHVGCHAHPSPLDLVGSIQNSCNAYYCNTFRHIIDNSKYDNTTQAFKSWRNYVMSLGFGVKLDTDFPNELSGNVPSSDYYDRYFGVNRWRSLTIISLAIGQGEMGTTPLQIANFAALIANRGYYYSPHIIKKIEGEKTLDSRFSTPHYGLIDSSYYKYAIAGMEQAVLAGTARGAQLPGIAVCGKTGTAQNPHGKDHSIFMSFAPKDNPKIAIAVFVENAGFGATYAVPIASLMMEKYLTGKITRDWLEQNMLNANLMSDK